MLGIGTKQIETKRLILRKIEKNDYINIYKNWTSDKITTRYLTWDIHASLEETKKYVEYKLEKNKKPYSFDWLIVLKETNEPIGEIEAVDVSLRDKLVTVGYCIGSKYFGNGYVLEALNEFIKYMFEEVKVDKIICCHISTNPNSGKVMAKAGMKKDGVLKGYLIDKNTDKREDQVWYSIDRKD